MKTAPGSSASVFGVEVDDRDPRRDRAVEVVVLVDLGPVLDQPADLHLGDLGVLDHERRADSHDGPYPAASAIVCADDPDRQVARQVVVVARRVVDAGVRGEVLGRVELVAEGRLERDRIEPIGEVGPCPDRFRDRVRAAGAVAQVLLDVADAERAADRDQEVDPEPREDRLRQHVIGDHRAEAVRDDDLRARAAQEGLADRRSHRLGPRAVQVIDDVAGQLADDEPEDRIREGHAEGPAGGRSGRSARDQVGAAVELRDQPPGGGDIGRGRGRRCVGRSSSRGDAAPSAWPRRSHRRPRWG